MVKYDTYSPAEYTTLLLTTSSENTIVLLLFQRFTRKKVVYFGNVNIDIFSEQQESITVTLR